MTQERRALPRHDCEFCDELGYVLDPGDKYGWLVPCDHFAGQTIPVKPGHHPEGRRPRTPEEIRASLEDYWTGVRNMFGGKYAGPVVPRNRGPEPEPAKDYDPDAWQR